jgi:hypothetical protein
MYTFTSFVKILCAINVSNFMLVFVSVLRLLKYKKYIYYKVVGKYIFQNNIHVELFVINLIDNFFKLKQIIININM